MAQGIKGSTPTCKAPGCSRKADSNGECPTHYSRMKRHNSYDDPRPTLEERFWPKVDKTSHPDGCWLWTGAKIKDYGIIHVRGRKNVRTHRVAYELLVGPVPDGLELDHLCRNPPCCNPAHLEAVSHKVNSLRGESPWARNARKTHCKRGHPFDEANTYVRTTGDRACRKCQRMLWNEWKTRQDAKKVAP